MACICHVNSKIDMDQVVRSYKKWTCLWDRSHQDYRQLKKREMALIDISLKWGGPPYHTIGCVRKQIKTMRDTYRQERSKFMESLSTKLTWFQEADSFLKKCMVMFHFVALFSPPLSSFPLFSFSLPLKLKKNSTLRSLDSSLDSFSCSPFLLFHPFEI